MKPFLIIKTGGTFPEYAEGNGDFEQWTADGMGLGATEWEYVTTQEGELPASPDQYAGCVITGSHEMVTDGDAWIHETGKWVVNAVKAGLPVLGICFGHQLMAHCFGGEAGDHPKGLEVGTVPIIMNEHAAEDPLFSQFPPIFSAHATHAQTALKVPCDATILASSGHDAHHAVRFAEGAWGVQFHPEFDADAISYYVEMLSDKLTMQRRNVPAIQQGVEDTPISAGLLPAFVEYCRNR